MAARKTKDGAGFTAEEREAMRDRAAELKSERGGKADGEAALREKIAAMPDGDRELAERVHAIVTETAPELEPRTWYGMPAWAKGGKVLCFFQGAARFKTRYATFGFSDRAALDDGDMWPVTYALTTLGPGEEARLAALVRQAAGVDD